MKIDPNCVWAVICNREGDKETFTILFADSTLNRGDMLFFDTEEELRAELELMGQSKAKQDELIARARQAADQKAA